MAFYTDDDLRHLILWLEQSTLVTSHAIVQRNRLYKHIFLRALVLLSPTIYTEIDFIRTHHTVKHIDKCGRDFMLSHHWCLCHGKQQPFVGQKKKRVKEIQNTMYTSTAIAAKSRKKTCGIYTMISFHLNHRTNFSCAIF